MKLKTRKSALKRIKVKKKTFFHKKANKSHLLRKKTSKNLRNLSKLKKINLSDFNSFLKMIPYSIK